jgi:peptidoglycan/LPS O-acetylase OafA/YrhL
MSTDVSPAAGPDLSRRDPTLDLARVAAVFLVVVVHLLQVGVGRGPDGAIVTSRPAEAQSWFDAATWVGQIMPLFFVVGGFASAAGWASWTARGGDAAGFVRTRTLRLVQPALALFGVVAAVLLGGRVAGVDPSLIDAAVVGIGMPLWFLAAYLLCQLVVPVAVAAHDRAPRLSLGILLSATIAIDALRFSTGIELLGYLNMLFVWPLIQQLGFWYRDGWFDRRGTPALLGVAGAAYLLLGIIVTWGPYSSSMLANLNPPTLPLVLLGVAQACLLRVARPVLAGLMRTRAAQAVVFAMGSRLMTVYLWHLPVILVVSGLALLVPGAAPVPTSGEWWATRPVLLVVVALVLGALSLPLARIEALGRLGAAPRPWLIGVAWLLAFLPPFAVTVEGMDAVLAVCGAAMYMAAVLILRTRSR